VANGRRSTAQNFLTAVLYGVALMSGLSNTVALMLALGGTATFDWSLLSLGLLGWGIVLMIHYRRGWFPFRRSGY
jgi:hypothetical protein